jgi:hypothetical protein
MGATDETHVEGCNDTAFMAVILLYHYLIPNTYLHSTSYTLVSMYHVSYTNLKYTVFTEIKDNSLIKHVS